MPKENKERPIKFMDQRSTNNDINVAESVRDIKLKEAEGGGKEKHTHIIFHILCIMHIHSDVTRILAAMDKERSTKNQMTLTVLLSCV
jgi:hypothetical protein